MRSFLTKITERSSFSGLMVLWVISAITMYLMFNPASPWFAIIDTVPVAPPETTPGLATGPVFQFLSVLSAEQQGTYLYMHGIDALYYFTLGAALLALFGLVIRRFGWAASPMLWVLILPIALVVFESLESISLLASMFLLPTRIEPLLWMAEIATAGKMVSYLVALVFFGLAVLLLPVSLFVKRT